MIRSETRRCLYDSVMAYARYDAAFRKQGLTPDQHYRERQQRSAPLLDVFRELVDNNITKSDGDSLTGIAMTYMRKPWPWSIAYCYDGRLHTSDILAKNAIRHFVCGRKSLLFSDTPKDEKSGTMHYNLIVSARANSLGSHYHLHRRLKHLA